MQLRYLENFSSPDLAGNSFPQERARGAVLDPRGGRFPGGEAGGGVGLGSGLCRTELQAGRPRPGRPLRLPLRAWVRGSRVSQWQVRPCSAGVPPYPCFQSVPGSCEGPNPRWAELRDGSELPTSGGTCPPCSPVPKWGRDFEYNRISLLELGEIFLAKGDSQI